MGIQHCARAHGLEQLGAAGREAVTAQPFLERGDAGGEGAAPALCDSITVAGVGCDGGGRSGEPRERGRGERCGGHSWQLPGMANIAGLVDVRGVAGVQNAV